MFVVTTTQGKDKDYKQFQYWFSLEEEANNKYIDLKEGR
jgi:hypothetical protein